MECSVSTYMNVPPERAFEAVSNFAGAAGTVKGIRKVEMLTTGPTGVGTKFRETRVMFGREASEVMEVTRFDAPRGYTLECVSHGCHYRTDLSCQPKGQGTEVSMSFKAVARTFPAKVMSTLMGPFVLKQCRAALQNDLADVKAAVEAAGTPAGR